jgi:ribosomal protein S18 acetylase RimI-like enzyme
VNVHHLHVLRPAERDDARAMAHLIDIAGEGIPSWLWASSGTPGDGPIDVGEERARRETGGFSYRHAIVAEVEREVVAMALSYPIETPPTIDQATLPLPLVPFVILEAESVGTWYVNALAVFPAYRNCGIGRRLIEAVEATAKLAGHSTMSIQVFSWNAGAIRLYERQGFRPVSRSPVLCHTSRPAFDADVILLKKELDDAE